MEYVKKLRIVNHLFHATVRYKIKKWQEQNNHKDKKGKDKFNLHEKWEKICQSALRGKNKPESEESGKTGINNSETDNLPSKF